MKAERRPEAAPDNYITLADDPPSITDRADHRRRQLHRLTVIAQVRAFYGPDADLRLSPPGPSCCPDGCPWCPPPLQPGEPDYTAGLMVRSA